MSITLIKNNLKLEDQIGYINRKDILSNELTPLVKNYSQENNWLNCKYTTESWEKIDFILKKNIYIIVSDNKCFTPSNGKVLKNAKNA